MKIVSKFRDYYDSLAYISHDKSLVFVRKQEKLHEFTDVIGKNASPVSYNSWECESGKYKISIHCYYIGFCGEIYPVAKIVKRDRYYALADDIVEYAYSAESLFDIIDADNAKVKALRFSFTKETIEKFFKKAQKSDAFSNGVRDPVEKYRKIFLEKRVASFIIGPDEITSYPILSEHCFGKVMDSYTAFQKLEQFLTNDLAPRDVQKAWPISDKLKVHTHGFDKYSFRKEKSK